MRRRHRYYHRQRQPPVVPDRRPAARGTDTPLYPALHAILREVRDLRVALGLLLLAGLAICVLASWAFAALADAVTEGDTLWFDVAALRWVAAHRPPWVVPAAVEITTLGTWGVVLLASGIAALFLALTRHRYSAGLVLAATAGVMLINSLLKLGFDRPRPRVFAWSVDVLTSSFPSGHAAAAAAAYGTIAYVAARLQRHHWARRLTLLTAVLLVLAIAASRVLLGVHYPSDVLGGLLVGTAWAAFCAAGIEAVQRVIRRERPGEVADEMPAPEVESPR
ncbi:MAG TPA: phosphatase PAP2 family protein [Gemmatimonadaceae bacterium]|nr:phosphatase PAP2 family protein [Gemmatimonadaceae bacterium]